MKLTFKANLDPVMNILQGALSFGRILRRFHPYLRPQLQRLVLASAASIGFSVTSLLEPWPLQILFDGIFLGRSIRFLGIDLLQWAKGDAGILLVGISLSVVILSVLRGQFYYAQNVLAAISGQDVIMKLRRQVFQHLQTLSLRFHNHARLGDILMRLTGDIVMLREMVSAAIVNLFSQGMVLVGTLIIMIYLNLRLTLVAATVIPILFLILTVFRIRLVEAARKQRKQEGVLASRAQEVLQGIQHIQAYTVEDHENERFKQMNKKSLRAGVRTIRLEGQLNRAIEITMAGSLCLVLWFGAREVMAERLSPGELLVFLAYLRGVYRPMRQLSKVTQRMAKASACGHRVLEILDQVPEVQDAPGAILTPKIQGRITLRGVTFRYDTEKPVLRDINLDILPGEKVAIVGPTGTGKTTLLSLIPRFYDPQEGEILLDGIHIRNIRLKSLRGNIAMVLQETVIMGATIRENIAYGATDHWKTDLSEAKIESVARAAQAHDFIIQLSRGYDTIVGERGSTLSGGQRQRIAIARAILRNAPILLMDEPMTGLDPLTEKEVLGALETLIRGRTTLLIAHNLSTVLMADRIIFLENGCIMEEGTHKELLALGGRYASFFHINWRTIGTFPCT